MRTEWCPLWLGCAYLGFAILELEGKFLAGTLSGLLDARFWIPRTTSESCGTHCGMSGARSCGRRARSEPHGARRLQVVGAHVVYSQNEARNLRCMLMLGCRLVDCGRACHGLKGFFLADCAIKQTRTLQAQAPAAFRATATNQPNFFHVDDDGWPTASRRLTTQLPTCKLAETHTRSLTYRRHVQPCEKTWHLDNNHLNALDSLPHPAGQPKKSIFGGARPVLTSDQVTNARPLSSRLLWAVRPRKPSAVGHPLPGRAG